MTRPIVIEAHRVVIACAVAFIIGFSTAMAGAIAVVHAHRPALAEQARERALAALLPACLPVQGEELTVRRTAHGDVCERRVDGKVTELVWRVR